MEIVLNLLAPELKPKALEPQRFLENTNGVIKFEHVSLEQSQEYLNFPPLLINKRQYFILFVITDRFFFI
jgi:hypothetical protein